jgi:hypothetical protein
VIDGDRYPLSARTCTLQRDPYGEGAGAASKAIRAAVQRPIPKLPVKSYPCGRPATLGRTAAAHLLLGVVQGLRPPGVEDPAEMVERCGAATMLLDWRERLVCAQLWQLQRRLCR